MGSRRDVSEEAIALRAECDSTKKWFDEHINLVGIDRASKHYMILGYNYNDIGETVLAQECFSKMTENYMSTILIEDMKSAFEAGSRAHERDLNGLDNKRDMEEFEVFIVIMRSLPLFVVYNVIGRDMFMSQLNGAKFPINMPRVLKLIGGDDEDTEF